MKHLDLSDVQAVTVKGFPRTQLDVRNAFVSFLKKCGHAVKATETGFRATPREKERFENNTPTHELLASLQAHTNGSLKEVTITLDRIRTEKTTYELIEEQLAKQSQEVDE